MTCTKPLYGWWSTSGKFTAKASEAYLDAPMEINCGRCIGCRLAKTSDWATRIMHEAQLHNQNAFVTLSYNDDKLPRKGDIISKRKGTYVKENYTLVTEHLQTFFKRLRKYLEPKKIRYFACGEYGSRLGRENYNRLYQRDFGRPHYHCIIFDYFPDDIKIYKETKFGKLYTSAKLEKLWKNGFVIIGNVDYESASYTASYTIKKFRGKPDDVKKYYGNNIPEFACMSRKPGIAYDWYEKYKKSTFDTGTVVMRGHERNPPKYYQRKFKEEAQADEQRLYNSKDMDEKEILDLVVRRNREYNRKKEKIVSSKDKFTISDYDRLNQIDTYLNKTIGPKGQIE